MVLPTASGLMIDKVRSIAIVFPYARLSDSKIVIDYNNFSNNLHLFKSVYGEILPLAYELIKSF